MSCRDVKVSISPYLDGQLDSLQIRLIEEHVAGCAKCREKLELMQQIPEALQTDRMLAPRPEFTKMVMQRIIVRQQVGNATLETRLDQVSLQHIYRESDHSSEDEPPDGTDKEDDSVPSNVISLADRRNSRKKTPSDYVLRFSSVAAVLVVMVGFSIYALAQPANESVEPAIASVYGAIKGFAESLRAALNSPVELIAGIAIAGVIIISLWYGLRTLQANQEIGVNSDEPASNQRRRA